LTVPRENARLRLAITPIIEARHPEGEYCWTEDRGSQRMFSNPYGADRWSFFAEHCDGQGHQRRGRLSGGTAPRVCQHISGPPCDMPLLPSN